MTVLLDSVFAFKLLCYYYILHYFQTLVQKLGLKIGQRFLTYVRIETETDILSLLIPLSAKHIMFTMQIVSNCISVLMQYCICQVRSRMFVIIVAKRSDIWQR
jgi:hypothetical protein